MIVAVTGQYGGCELHTVAAALAELRARSGRKVILVGTDPRRKAQGCGGVQACAVRGRYLQSELEALLPQCEDIVIDTDADDTIATRPALIAAKLAVVPVRVGQVDLAGQYQLVARLNSARMFNPGLRVMFVIVGSDADPTPDEVASVRNYVSHVMAATLAGTVIHAEGGLDAANDADMHALYREVFAH